MVWVFSEQKVTTNQYRGVVSAHLYNMMKHFSPDGSRLSQQVSDHMHRLQEAPRVDEYKNYATPDYYGDNGH